jgi:hypothetical protein
VTGTVPPSSSEFGLQSLESNMGYGMLSWTESHSSLYLTQEYGVGFTSAGL